MSLSRGMQLKVISAGQLKSRGPAQALSVAAIGTGQRACRHCPVWQSPTCTFLYECCVCVCCVFPTDKTIIKLTILHDAAYC